MRAQEKDNAMAAPSEWWRNFFHGTMVEGWLAAMPNEMTQKEADFVQKVLQVTPPAKLLDAPCGGGRHSLALAARGYNLTSVDISPTFLEAARAKANPGPGKVTWEERDMRDLPWPSSVDGAYCMGNSFGYYDDAGNEAFIRAVARALKPGARFVLNTDYLTEGLLPVLQERAWYEMGGILCLTSRRYDPADGRLYVEYTTIRDGKVEKWSMSARLHTLREVRRLFEAAGFTNLCAYSSLAQEPFQFGSRQLYLVGTR
jgi:SAM-dependent methyltransferase